LKIIEPATEKVLAEVPEADIAEADQAVARAKAAFPAAAHEPDTEAAPADPADD